MIPIFILAACSPPEATPLAFDYTLIWEEQFEGEAGAPPNANNWTHEIGTGPNGDGWGNNQEEYNTDREENVRLDGEGNLVIRAVREEYEGMRYTSGRIKTQDKFEQTYGRFEARVMIPEGQGLWPAFWLLGASYETDIWPICGEIDILEFQGSRPERLIGSLHGPGHSGGESLSNYHTLSEGSFADDFHVFSVDWDADQINWYVDDNRFHSVSRGQLPANSAWVYDHPFFILLNLAVGGNFVDSPLTTSFPGELVVDYVKVYERND